MPISVYLKGSIWRSKCTIILSLGWFQSFMRLEFCCKFIKKKTFALSARAVPFIVHCVNTISVWGHSTCSQNYHFLNKAGFAFIYDLLFFSLEALRLCLCESVPKIRTTKAHDSTAFYPHNVTVGLRGYRFMTHRHLLDIPLTWQAYIVLHLMISKWKVA